MATRGSAGSSGKETGVAAGEIGPRRAAVRHEQGITDECGVADHMRHASRRMAGGMNSKRLHGANLITVAILEQAVKLAAVAPEFGTFVEDLAKSLLHDRNSLTYADPAAELTLDIGRAGKMIGMNMGLDQPFNASIVAETAASKGRLMVLEK